MNVIRTCSIAALGSNSFVSFHFCSKSNIDLGADTTGKLRAFLATDFGMRSACSAGEALSIRASR